MSDQEAVIFDLIDSLLGVCGCGLPARLLCDALVSQGISEQAASAAIRDSLDQGSIKLGVNMHLIRTM